MLIALALTASLTAASAGLLIKDSGLTAAAKDASIDDAIRAGARDDAQATKALELVMSSSDATPVQAWRALKGVAKHDASVQAKLDAMVPALPFTAATGAQAKALNGSFERALLDSGALPITADPARRKGELKVTWTMRMVDDTSSKERAWSIDATATLSPNDIVKGAKIGAKPFTVKTKTLVKGATAEKAALAGMADAADDLVKAVLFSMARDAVGAPTGPVYKASPRTLEKVAALRERAADGDRKSQAVLDSFPARIDVNVDGRGDMRVWTRSIEEALVGVSAHALPLRSEHADHTMKVVVEIEENSGNVLAAGTLRRYTVKSKASFLNDDGKVLASIQKITLSMGSTPEEAAAAGAEKTARALYEAMLDEVSALRHRRVASR
jgi:hypothetical protein